MLKSITATAVAATALALSGCSFSIGSDPTIDAEVMADQLETEIAAYFENEVDPEVDCGEGEIEYEVGTEYVCGVGVVGDDVVFDVTVTITSIDGEDYTYEWAIADEPRS